MNDTQRTERARNAANRRWNLRRHVLWHAALLLETYRDSGWESLFDDDGVGGTEESQFSAEEKNRISQHLNDLIAELHKRGALLV